MRRVVAVAFRLVIARVGGAVLDRDRRGVDESSTWAAAGGASISVLSHAALTDPAGAVELDDRVDPEPVQE